MRPDDPALQEQLGVALLAAGDSAGAIAAFEAALALRPNDGATLFRLGNALLARDEFAAAAERFRQSLAVVPDHPGTHNNLGNALRGLGQMEAAAASFREAARLRPSMIGAQMNLGNALLALHRPAEALAWFEAVLRLAPNYVEAHNSTGGALLALDRADAALQSFRRALTFEPQHVQARFGEAMALLTLGRLREGFIPYEARWRDPRFCEDERRYDVPLWLGDSPVAGRVIVLHAEQGLGDTIQFARYAPLLRARGARVVLEVQPALTAVLAPLADAVVAAGADLPAHDLHCPVASLPRAFGTDLDTIPAAIPYLTARTARTDLRGPGFNIGVAFSGSPDHPDDALRSIPAVTMAPLWDLPGVTWHVVQKEVRAADAAALVRWPTVRRHDGELGDFLETAAILAAMDLIVSVDTSVAHLAGAMGRPVWILVQRSADFRWMRERSDSPWYPTARLLRQGEGGWPGVLAEVARALDGMRA